MLMRPLGRWVLVAIVACVAPCASADRLRKGQLRALPKGDVFDPKLTDVPAPLVTDDKVVDGGLVTPQDPHGEQKAPGMDKDAEQEGEGSGSDSGSGSLSFFRLPPQNEEKPRMPLLTLTWRRLCRASSPLAAIFSWGD